MCRSLASVALLAGLTAVACTDTTPTGIRTPATVGGPLFTVSVGDHIDEQIPKLFKKGHAQSVQARWNTVKNKKADGDVEGAHQHFVSLADWIEKKTPDVTPPAGETQQQAATGLVYAMAVWLHVGPDAPIPQVGGDSKFAVVPAGEAATVVTEKKQAGVDIEAGSTDEDRVIVVAEDAHKYPGLCNGPLDTELCQGPLFYRFESYPHKRLKKVAHFAVCHATAGERRPLDYAEGHPSRKVGGSDDNTEEVHHRMRLAHAKPADPADYTPGGTVVDGIEILPKSAAQKGFTDCDKPVDYALAPGDIRGGWRGRAQRALLAVANFAGRLLTPKNLYAFSSGPEHDGAFFSPFNAVDPESKPDLKPEGLTAPAEVVRGEAATIGFVVTNKSRRQPGGSATGASKATSATVYLVRDGEAEPVQVGPLCKATEGEEELCVFAVPAMRPDDAPHTISEPLLVPADIAPGEWFVEVRVAPSPGRVGEVDVANNILRSAEPIRIHAPGDEVDVLGTLASTYGQLRNTLWAYYNLSEISSEEMIVPTRGQDWYDNGRWLEIDRQQWTSSSPAGLEDINAAWVDAQTGIERANVVLGALPGASVPNKAVVEAEARALRAFYYYMLMDMFAGVPIVTASKAAPQPRNTRAEVFQFIEAELTEARATLPVSWPAGDYGRMTKGAADAILANMYLNAGVFSRDVGVSASAYNSCQQVQLGGSSACQKAIEAADRILNSGVYSLAADWHSNFRTDNHTSPENILVVKHLNQPGLGLNFVMRALHYSQHSPDAWNGFSTIADVYNAFDPSDRRREIFLVGPQVGLDPQRPNYNQPVNDRAGNPLVFTPTIANIEQATEGEGARIMKWPIDPSHAGPDHGNDYAYFRLAEVYLIKAEALLELGRAAEALSLLNVLRTRVFETGAPLSTINREVILRERLFELTAEAKRRQDLIRHGRYTDAWQYKAARPAHVILMPIPAHQLNLNPLLVQNPGY